MIYLILETLKMFYVERSSFVLSAKADLCLNPNFKKCLWPEKKVDTFQQMIWILVSSIYIVSKGSHSLVDFRGTDAIFYIFIDRRNQREKRWNEMFNHEALLSFYLLFDYWLSLSGNFQCKLKKWWIFSMPNSKLLEERIIIEVILFPQLNIKDYFILSTINAVFFVILLKKEIIVT